MSPLSRILLINSFMFRKWMNCPSLIPFRAFLRLAGCHILFLRRAAWQREEEAARDEGGYQRPTCPPHRRPNALLFGFPSFRFRILQIRIYTHIQPHPYTHTHPRRLAELWFRGAHSPVPHYFFTDHSLGLYRSSPTQACHLFFSSFWYANPNSL